jgi:alcohol dehydrogenase
MVATGALDLSYLQTKPFPLARVNEAISGLEDRDGGFSNYVVIP